MLASGLYVASNPRRPFTDLHAELLGRAPKLADGHSIFAVSGEVKVNGRVARMDTFVSTHQRTKPGFLVVRMHGQCAIQKIYDGMHAIESSLEQRPRTS